MHADGQGPVPPSDLPRVEVPQAAKAKHESKANVFRMWRFYQGRGRGKLARMETADLNALRAAHLDELSRRYARVLDECSLDAVVLHSGLRRPRREWDDQYWPLWPVPHFAHWLPLAHPECLIVVEKGKPPRFVRWVDESFWEQPPVEEVAPEGFEVVEVRDPEKAGQHLPGGRSAFVGEAGAAVWSAFADERRNPPALIAALERERTRKTAYEVECIAEANRRAARGHKRVAEAFQANDLSELQLHLAYLAVTEQDDPETPYKNIVAKGEHAATLHHVTYTRRAASEQSLLLDAGATFRGYQSDVTRTHVRGVGETAERFRALVAGVDALQQRLCAAVQPGTPYEALHDRSHVELAGVLREIGLVKLSVEEAVASGLTRAFYPHGLGHSLGLQTHDVGCALVKPRRENPFLRNTSPIAVGQVFTIEPGCYFIPALLRPIVDTKVGAAVDWEGLERIAYFGGVRVEDDLFVGESGVRNLTREAFA